MPDVYLFERLLGRATVKLWDEIPRDLQRAIFERAIQDDLRLRTPLAIFLHGDGTDPTRRT